MIEDDNEGEGSSPSTQHTHVGTVWVRGVGVHGMQFDK